MTPFQRGVEAAAQMAEHWAESHENCDAAITLRDLADRMRKVLGDATPPPAPGLAAVGEVEVERLAVVYHMAFNRADSTLDGFRAVVAAIRADAAPDRYLGPKTRCERCDAAKEAHQPGCGFFIPREPPAIRAEATPPVDLAALRAAVRDADAFFAETHGPTGDIAASLGAFHNLAELLRAVRPLVDTTPAEPGPATFCAHGFRVGGSYCARCNGTAAPQEPTEPVRCEARLADMQCERPTGHRGSHSVSTGDAVGTWPWTSDEKGGRHE